nr:DivIVA domain-containing protein [Nocardioides anomalus]
MGGVAALAAGRGAPMAEAYDDRPDALVPREGTLGAEDVRRVRFSLAFRGYRMSEVDTLLDRLARQLEDAERPAVEAAPAPEPEPAPAGETVRAETPSETPLAPEARGDDHAP